MHRKTFAGLLLLLPIMACSSLSREPAPATPATGGTAPMQTAAQAAKAGGVPPVVPSPAAAPQSPAPAASQPVTAAAAVVAPKNVAPAAAVTPLRVDAARKPLVQTDRAAVAKPAAAVAADKPSVLALDLTALEQRLRDTRAIGVFTKLSLKNQVDELLAEFRAYYAGRDGATLVTLRQRYDLLLMKVLSVLQDGDPPLASAIASSRDAIWVILTNKEKFQKI